MNYDSNIQKQHSGPLNERRDLLSTRSVNKNNYTKGVQELPKNQGRAQEGQFNKNVSNKIKTDNSQSREQIFQIDKLQDALRNTIDENEILRSRVEELEAYYVVAEEEVEKRDEYIQQLFNQISKMETKKSIGLDKLKNISKRSQSQ